jgi:hypothetical protein
MRQFVFIMLGTCSIAGAQTASLSVCEVLNSTLDHWETTIRGKISGSSHHGFFLSEGINADPCPGWPRRFFTAPAVIGLYLASALGVEVTEEQKASNIAFLRRLRKEKRPYEPTFTITGVVVRRPWSPTYRRADGNYMSLPDEYGWLRAVIVMKSTKEENN